jgi:bifunctional non-homologous end joining protein LigD
MRQDAVVDGELVALDGRGISHFQLLQNARRKEASLRFCVFDVMFAGEEDLRGLPLVERKKRLKRLLPKNPLLVYSAHRRQYGTRFFSEAEHDGLEGIMAKRVYSRYLSGVRTMSWLKIKTSKRQEVVIAGYTAPRGARSRFGALVLAVRVGERWRYIGRVGAGFSSVTLEELYGKLSKLRTDVSPFDAKVKDEALTTWVKPKLIAEVKFTEWTQSGEMRHPVYLGLREDKRAEDVVREEAKEVRPISRSP